MDEVQAFRSVREYLARRIPWTSRARIDPLAGPASPALAARPGHVDYVAELYERTIARVTNNLYTVVTISLVVATAGLLIRVSSGSAVVAWGLVAVLSAALWRLRRHARLATAFALVLLEVILIATLVAFGPMAGTGALVAMAVLLARIHFSRATSLGAAIVATGTYVGVGALVVSHGWGEMHLPLFTWVRTGSICGAISIFMALAAGTLLSGLRSALAELEQVRRVHEQAQADLARHRELQTAGRLLGGVAHDVNNSLTVVACCADELRQEALSPSALDLVRDIETTTHAASGTVHAMLDLVRPRPSEAPRCDPARVLGEAVRNLQRLLPDDVKLATALMDGHTVPLSRAAVLQTVLNLVLNARDALEGDNKEITLVVEPSDSGVVVAVRDSGSGMDAATLARLGEPFFSTKGRAGNGLGLSMVRATVEACGGRVEFESTPGRGTAVRIVLPEVTAAPEEAADMARADMTDRRVLLVEDDDLIRRAFARGLSAAGASVTEAASVAQAKVAIGEAVQAFDLLVCDGILGDGTFADVVGPFHDRYAASPVLLCTGHAPDVLASRGVTPTATATVAKPISGAQLAREAARALRESLPRQPLKGADRQDARNAG